MPAESNDQGRIVFLERSWVANFEGGHRERNGRLHEAETAFVVVADDLGRGDDSGIGCHGDFDRFQDHISDRQDQAVIIDDDAAALSLVTEHLGG